MNSWIWQGGAILLMVLAGDVTYYASLQPPPHPRLFFTDVATLWAKSHTARGQELWKALQREADAALKGDLVTIPPLADKSHRYEHKDIPPEFSRARRQIGRLPVLALAYLMTQETKYLARAKEIAFHALTLDTWVHPFHFPLEMDLTAAEISMNLALAYDWLYQALSEEERQRLREGLVKRGLEPFYRLSKGGVWWSKARHNWRAVVEGGCGVAALALLGDHPDAPRWVAEAAEKMAEYPSFFGPNGGWGEGVGYWNYGTTYLTYFADALKIVTQGEENLFAHRGYRESVFFPLYNTLPPNRCVNFADAGPSVPRTPLYDKFAAEYRNPYATWQGQEYGRGAALWQFLWFDPTLEPKNPTEDLPLGRYFEGIEWVVSRCGFGREDQGLILAMTAGTNGQNHGHLDAGGFVLHAFGETFIRDLGAEPYTGAYFSRRRWTFYRANTFGHNTVLLNDENQRPGAMGRVEDFVTTTWADAYTLNLDEPYREVARSARRHLAFLRPHVVVFYDEFVPQGKATAQWRFHPGGEVELGEDGFTVTGQRGRLTVTLRLLAPLSSERGTASATEDRETGKWQQGRMNGRDLAVSYHVPARERHEALVIFQVAPRGAELAETVTVLEGERVRGVEVRPPEGRVLILFAVNGKPLRYEDLESDATIALVSFDAEGKVVNTLLSGGTYLRVGGQTITLPPLAGHS